MTTEILTQLGFGALAFLAMLQASRAVTRLTGRTHNLSSMRHGTLQVFLTFVLTSLTYTLLSPQSPFFLAAAGLSAGIASLIATSIFGLRVERGVRG